MNYHLLKLYCDRAAITYQEFGAMVDPTGSVSWRMIYAVITGRRNPGKRTRRTLDRFISKNRRKLEKALGQPIITGEVSSTAGACHEAV